MFGAAIRYVVDLLTAGGVSAAGDPADLNVPGVWVTPEAYAATQLNGRTQVTLTATLVAASRDQGQAVADLDALADAMTAAGFPVTDVTAVTVVLPNHNPGGLPGYQTTITLLIDKET